MALTIRLADAFDAAGVLAIYEPIVRNTIISFEFEPPTVTEIRNRITKTLEKFPWLVCEQQGEILGYAYAGPHRTRLAYQWSVDVSVYIAEQGRRLGIGHALYTSLFRVLVLQGFHNAYAGIALPNPASVGLHEAVGFRPVGVYQAVGYKFGAWHDVGWWQCALQPRVTEPPAPTDLEHARNSTDWEAGLAAGLPFLRA